MGTCKKLQVPRCFWGVIGITMNSVFLFLLQPQWWQASEPPALPPLALIYASQIWGSNGLGFTPLWSSGPIPTFHMLPKCNSDHFFLKSLKLSHCLVSNSFLALFPIILHMHFLLLQESPVSHQITSSFQGGLPPQCCWAVLCGSYYSTFHTKM